jgi:hypothetical protein
VPDVASGFKAYSREAAMRFALSTDFDHTVDHVIQAGRKRIITRSVPIRTNEKLRESRLFSNIWIFITQSLSIMLRVYSSYRALKIFSMAGIITFGAGFIIGLRFLYFYFYTDEGDLHVQSLILAAVLLLTGFQIIINANRSLVEDISYRIRRMELEREKADTKAGTWEAEQAD